MVTGDFNEDPSDNQDDGLLHLMKSCSLLNVFETCKSHMPSTRNNSRAIDHFLISAEIAHLVTQAGLLPDEVGFTSDYAGLFVDLSPKILETKNTPIIPPKQRKLKCYNKLNVEKYKTYVLEQFEAHNIVNRMKRLSKVIENDGFTSELGDELNRIDKQVTDILLRAEDKLSPGDTSYAYSMEIDKQMRVVRLIKRLQNQHVT